MHNELLDAPDLPATIDHEDILNALLEESLAPPRALAASAALDPLDDLDALLAESLSHKAKEERHKRNREAQKRGFVGISKEEAAEINEQVRQWELEREWRPDSNLAIFTRQTCVCGTQSLTFSRFMQHQVHREKVTVARWVKTPAVVIGIPTLGAVEDKAVCVCAECATPIHDINLSTLKDLDDVLGTK